MAVRAVLLDFGGTLVESVPDSFRVYAWVFERFRVRVARADWERAQEKAWSLISPRLYAPSGRVPSFWDQVHAEVLRELGLDDPGGRIREALRDRFTSPELHRPFPESEAVLRALSGGDWALHLVSNNTDYLLETLRRLGWTHYFRSVTYSQEAGAEKPDPRVFGLALRRARCTAPEAVYVGDSWEADVVGASRAGIRAIWVRRRGSPAPGPALTISGLGELRARLETLG